MKCTINSFSQGPVFQFSNGNTVLTLAFIFIIFQSCSSVRKDITSDSALENTIETKNVFWVNGIKTECSAGAGKQECMSIRSDFNDNKEDWELFYESIEGFTFEPGYFQKIEVSQVYLDPSKTPSDASTIKYKLVQILERKFDERFILNQIWSANRIYGKAIDSTRSLPIMEFDVSKMRVYGSNGCNKYNGSIEFLTASTIGFKKIASTKMMCRNMQTPDLFDKALLASNSYRLDKKILILFDSNGNETLSLSAALKD